MQRDIDQYVRDDQCNDIFRRHALTGVNRSEISMGRLESFLRYAFVSSIDVVFIVL